MLPPCCSADSARRSPSSRRSTRPTDVPTGAGPPRPSGRPGRRAVVVTPSMSRSLWRPYLPGLGRARAARRRRPGDRRRSASRPRAGTRRAISAAGRERAETGRGLPGRRRRAKADLHPRPLRRGAPHPVATSALAGLALTDEQPGMLLQGPERPAWKGSAEAGGSIPGGGSTGTPLERSVARPRCRGRLRPVPRDRRSTPTRRAA